MLVVLLTPTCRWTSRLPYSVPGCFQVWQLCRIDDDSITPHCCMHLLPANLVGKEMTDKLQSILKTAAQVILNYGYNRSCLLTYSMFNRRLTQFPCHTLHWLDFEDPVQSVCSSVQVSAQHGSQISSGALQTSLQHQQHLWPGYSGQLDVSRVRLSTYGRHTFCYAGPSAWNALPDLKKELCLLLDASLNSSTAHFISTLIRLFCS